MWGDYMSTVEKLLGPKSTTFSESSGRELSHGPIPEKFSLTKVCSEKISLIETVKLIFHSLYIGTDMLRSNKWDRVGIGLGWISVWGDYMSTALQC